jgi:hypothetical protein
MAEKLYPSVLKSYGRPLDELPPIVAVVRQIDDVLASVLGVAPAEPIFNFVRDIAPANIINTLTGIEKPGEVINDALADIAEKLRARAPRVR